MHLDYLILRMVRRLMPIALVNLLLRKRLIIQPGLETRDPMTAVQQYLEMLSQLGGSLTEKRVLLFGYGGSFAVGCLLLEAGAGHVVLCDKYAAPDERANADLYPQFSNYLVKDGEHVRPKHAYMTVIQDEIDQVARQFQIPLVDFVFSRSVLEHLENVEGEIMALAALTRPGGFHIHFINLSDHFFKYPFEMLTYNKNTWTKWLNPTSNLNRYRLPDYQRCFEKYFEAVQIKIIERKPAAFIKEMSRIHPEFLTGDPQVDAATRLLLIASQPKNKLANGKVSATLKRR